MEYVPSSRRSIPQMIAQASVAVFGVFETHGVEGLAASPGGVGVRSCTSSFEITFSGLRGARPAPLKPPRILLSVKVALNAV
ncbi:Uncharacterized protein HZ326_31669 [Fusarium oxysporum f. sp. albedinis]|nr:Uncharacterized protein HZ326_31669 [Fusarium oxysporum f. sp. albedinis]